MTRPVFSLFQSHIDLAHNYWKQHLSSPAQVIDATCGHGHDSLFIAQQCLTPEGQLYCIDIQQSALDSTKALLQQHLSIESYQRIHFFHQSHATFPLRIPPCDLILYNLGYLPRGDKSCTTMISSTLESFENALQLINNKGLISFTCYPGHPEGALEEQALLHRAKQLSPMDYLVCHHVFENRRAAPSLLLVFKRK